MKILVTGATGFLGAKIYATLSRKHQMAGTCFSKLQQSYKKLDITDQDQVKTCVRKVKPDVIVHTAGWADPDICDTDNEMAWKINVDGTKYLARAAQERNAKFIYISTYYVFDGKKGNYVEEDETNPISHYGVTKLEGERAVKNIIDNHIILRLPLLYGYNSDQDKATFVTKIVKALEENKSIELDNQELKSPTLIDDVAQVVGELVDTNKTGTYHFGVNDTYTYYTWGKKVAELYGSNPELVKESPSKEIRPGRPRNPSMRAEKIKQALSANPIGLDEGLKTMRNQKGCMFRMLYSVRPDKLVLNQSASDFRVKVGKLLGEKYPATADIVMGIPEAGMFEAAGYSEETRIPFHFGLIRDYFTDKTLFEPKQEQRAEALRRKLIAVPDVVKGKSIILVDEAVISGSTLVCAVDKLRTAGVDKIHVRIPSPIMFSNCTNRILSPYAKLVARDLGPALDPIKDKKKIEELLAEYFKVDSIKFLGVEEFKSLIDKREDSCVECFTKCTS